MKFKILLNFKRLPDNDLTAFAENIVTNMLDNPVYAAEATQLGVVSTALDEFSLAAVNARDGGRTPKRIRDEKRESLLLALSLLVLQLEMYLTKEASFFTATGFSLHKSPERNIGPLPRASLKYVRRGMMSGTVDGESQEFPDSVKQLAVEHSSDNGLTWQNGTYSTGKRFTLAGLPVKKDCLVRVRFHGTRQRNGDWSEPLSLFIL